MNKNILFIITRHLTGTDRINCSYVCSKWRQWLYKEIKCIILQRMRRKKSYIYLIFPLHRLVITRFVLEETNKLKRYKAMEPLKFKPDVLTVSCYNIDLKDQELAETFIKLGKKALRSHNRIDDDDNGVEIIKLPKITHKIYTVDIHEESRYPTINVNSTMMIHDRLEGIERLGPLASQYLLSEIKKILGRVYDVRYLPDSVTIML